MAGHALARAESMSGASAGGAAARITMDRGGSDGNGGHKPPFAEVFGAWGVLLTILTLFSVFNISEFGPPRARAALYQGFCSVMTVLMAMLITMLFWQTFSATCFAVYYFIQHGRAKIEHVTFIKDLAVFCMYFVFVVLLNVWTRPTRDFGFSARLVQLLAYVAGFSSISIIDRTRFLWVFYDKEGGSSDSNLKMGLLMIPIHVALVGTTLFVTSKQRDAHMARVEADGDKEQLHQAHVWQKEVSEGENDGLSMGLGYTLSVICRSFIRGTIVPMLNHKDDDVMNVKTAGQLSQVQAAVAILMFLWCNTVATQVVLRKKEMKKMAALVRALRILENCYSSAMCFTLLALVYWVLLESLPSINISVFVGGLFAFWLLIIGILLGDLLLRWKLFSQHVFVAITDFLSLFFGVAIHKMFIVTTSIVHDTCKDSMPGRGQTHLLAIGFCLVLVFLGLPLWKDFCNAAAHWKGMGDISLEELHALQGIHDHGHPDGKHGGHGHKHGHGHGHGHAENERHMPALRTDGLDHDHEGHGHGHGRGHRKSALPPGHPGHGKLQSAVRKLQAF